MLKKQVQQMLHPCVFPANEASVSESQKAWQERYPIDVALFVWEPKRHRAVKKRENALDTFRLSLTEASFAKIFEEKQGSNIYHFSLKFCKIFVFLLKNLLKSFKY